MSRCRRAVLALAWGLALAFLAGPARAEVPLASTDLRLPSEGAGGGTLAVRLTYPADVRDYRYADGAPVAIYLPGGFGAGSLAAPPQIPWQGFVLVTFLFPGGEGADGSSDGVYDYRGDDCQRALRDVIRFAEGAALDSLGRTIDDVVPGPVHPGMLSLAPFSNGLIGLVTLDRFGAAIPFAPFHVGWENPTNGQIVNGELGVIRDDCDGSVDSDANGLPEDDGRNPWYDPSTGYGATSFIVDTSRLAWDAAVPQHFTDPAGRCPPADRNGAVFHDGRTNGRLDFRPGLLGCTDFDGDGLLETTEDYQLRAIVSFSPSCVVKTYYSPEITAALAARGVFPGSWPPWIATPAEAGTFWDLRDATQHWDGLFARFPGFRAMTVFSAQDHVQSQPDHPHVRQVMDGVTSRGGWYRLNADATYFQEVFGSLPPGYVETPADAAVPAGMLKAHAEPKGTSSNWMSAAGHAELADRLHAGCWWSDLDVPLRPAVDPAAEVTGVAIAGDRNTVRWIAAAGAFCYDLVRGDVALLADDGSGVTLTGAACLAEDTPETVVLDTDRPDAGQAWYYVVRPNGLHGAYGAASNGHPRREPAEACVR